MRKILGLVLLIISVNVFGQNPPGYQSRIVRERIQGSFMVDSTQHIPRYCGTPSGVRGGGSIQDGAVAMDTCNNRFYIYSGGAWIRMANFSELYTTLSQFVDETAWRMFYSNGSGDITALAFGTSGKVLTSNGASAAPTWETPAAGLTGSGSANRVAYWNGASSLTYDNDFYFDGTDISLTAVDIYTGNTNYLAIGDNQSAHSGSSIEVGGGDNRFFIHTQGNGINGNMTRGTYKFEHHDISLMLLGADEVTDYTHKLSFLSDYTGAREWVFPNGNTKDTLATLANVRAGGGSGGGTDNANVGSGFRWLKPGTQEIKTVRGESGILIDSSSHTDELTIKADTTNANAGSLVTNGDFYRRLDSLNQRFIQLDQKTRYDQFLDIASSDFGAFAWSVGGSGAFIQGVSWVASPAIPVGWMLAQKMSTGTTSAGIAFHWTVVGGDYAAISMSSSYRYNFGVNMRLEDLSDGTNTFTYVTGFHDNNNNPGGIVDGVYFRYIHSDSSGKWIACTRNNSSVTEVATNVTVAADTDYKLEISVIGGSAFFYINDVLKATISTNIPDDDNARTVSVINLFQKTVGTAERFAWVEWMAYGKRND